MKIIKIKKLIKKYLSIYFMRKKIEKSEKNRAYIFLAADYPNMGDVAITKAQKKYIEDKLPDYEVIEIPHKYTYNYYKSIKKNIKKSDIITIIGGGNFGNNYMISEEHRRFVIKKFRKNKIISFPQTIDFSKDKIGEKELNKTIKIYSKNNKLHIFAREQKSYNIMKDKFKNNKIYFVPDIVLYLNDEFVEQVQRKHTLICLRNEKEKLITEDKKNKLLASIEKISENIVFQDTGIKKEEFNYERRYEILRDIVMKFKESKVVITDRLHGMILAAITGSPCIVFPNNNHKIKETYYNWLNDVKYIHFMEEVNNDEVLRLINYYNNSEEKTEVKDFKKDLKKLEEILIK